MAADEALLVNMRRTPVNDFPFAANHDAVRTRGPAQHQGCDRIMIAAMTKFIEPKEREIRLFTGREYANITSAETFCTAFGSKMERIQMTEPASPFAKALQHHGCSDFLDGIRGIIGGGSIDTETHRTAGSL